MASDWKPSGEVPQWSSDPLGRVRAELFCFMLVFRFHGQNNHLRKAVTIMLVFVWAVITLALTFDAIPAETPPYYAVLTAFVWAIVGRMWDFEINSFSDAIVDTQGGEDE
mgnify:CR=1 FL=1